MRSGRPADGVLLLDKPAGITSTRAMAMARRALDAAKVGHTGTLDPFATGLLPLVFGEGTKFSRFLIDSVKAYDARLSLGEETESGDPETPVRRITDVIPEMEEIVAVLLHFAGDIAQIPPMHSAVHVGGKRLYEYARAGEVVARPPRQVHISSIEMRGLAGRELDISVVCSKGTYIRVLAADIGRALGCGAYLTGLRRTAVGGFALQDAVPLPELSAAGPEGARSRLLPVETLVAALPRVDLDADAARRFCQGQVVAAIGGDDAPAVALYAGASGFLGVGERTGNRITALRLLAERPKSPDFA